MQAFNLRRLDPGALVLAILSVLIAAILILWICMFSLRSDTSRALKITLSAAAAATPVPTPQAGKPGGPPSQPAAAIPSDFQELIKKKAFFGKPPDPPPPQLQGVLGDSALISGNWIKVGESKGDTKLLETGPNKAVIEYKGERRELQIWSKLPGT